MLSPLASLGRHVLINLEGFGIFTRFVFSTFLWFFRGLAKWIRPSILMPQLYHIGTRSLPVVMLVGAFTGMVLAVEAYDQFAAIGQETSLGGIINVSVVKQIGPVLAAIMLAGRVGGMVSAQLGTMRVTEQLDAMRVMGADPIAYLVVPRVVACTVMIPLLTIFSDFMGVIGGFGVTVWGFGVNSDAYWSFSASFIDNFEVFLGLIKSVFFGLSIGLISCYKGFRCENGAAGVGKAATDAFVASFVAIIVSNFFIAKFSKHIYMLIDPTGGQTL